MPPRPMPAQLGKKLKMIRLHLGLTQDRLAEAIGHKNPSRRSRVHEWETSKRQPDLASLLAYARLVGISTDVLINDEVELDLSNVNRKDS